MNKKYHTDEERRNARRMKNRALRAKYAAESKIGICSAKQASLTEVRNRRADAELRKRQQLAHEIQQIRWSA